MLLNSIVKASASVGKQVIKHSPELLIVGGAVSGAVAAVMGVRSGIKIAGSTIVYKEEKERMDEIKEVMNGGDVIVTNDDGSIYTMEEWEKDKRKNQRYYLKDMALDLAPVVGFSLLSGAMILSGFKIMNARLSMLGSAVIALDHNFRKYRERVIENEGEDADFCYKTGAKMKKIEREVIDEETGEIKKKKIKEPVLGDDTVTPLDYSVNYLREATWLSEYQDMSKIMKDILMIQDSANMLLKHRWFMTWNDVRRMLHLKPTTAGQFVGWTMDPKSGDCEIDLRARVVYDELLGHDTVILDPNLDGLMANRIDEICEKRKEGIEL